MRLAILTAILFPLLVGQTQAEIIALGYFSFPSSYANGVSSDGSTAVGVGSGDPFLWTQSGGMTSLGTIAGGSNNGEARAASSDGSVVVGNTGGPGGTQAFRWTQSGGMTGLGHLTGSYTGSYSAATSSDGSVIVGYSGSDHGGTGGVTEAFRWTQSGGMVGLGDLSGGSSISYAFGTSSDGSVVVGYGTGASGTEAMHWTQSGGMVGIGDLTGGSFDSRALGISSDGSVLVGHGASASGREAFRWTQSGGMIGLGDLTGGSFQSESFATSGDGSVVVGRGRSASGDEAFYWTDGDGMLTLSSLLAAQGDDLSHWTKLTHAYGVSLDGQTVVGRGENIDGNLEAFVARLNASPVPEPSSLAFICVLGLGGLRRGRRRASSFETRC